MILLALALIAATPATLPAALGTARPGDTVRLAPGSYLPITLRDRSWLPAITLDARGATIVSQDPALSALTFANVTGVTVVGGIFIGPRSPPLQFWLRTISIETGRDLTFDAIRVEGVERRGFGLIAHRVTGLTVANSDFTNLHTAIQIDESTDAAVRNSRFFGLRSDGIDVAGSQRVVIEGIDCRDSQPQLTEPADHPDCVQLFSRRNWPPTADIVIRNNRAAGMTQGFTAFDHGEGGFDRVSITGNRVHTGYPQGIALYGARDSSITGNDVRTLPKSTYQTTINTEGPPVKIKGNRIRKKP